MAAVIAIVVEETIRLAIPVDDARWLAGELRRNGSGHLLTPATCAALNLELAADGRTGEFSVRLAPREAAAVTAALHRQHDALSEPLRHLFARLTDGPSRN
jgi:hypothetical protein